MGIYAGIVGTISAHGEGELAVVGGTSADGLALLVAGNEKQLGIMGAQLGMAVTLTKPADVGTPTRG